MSNATYWVVWRDHLGNGKGIIQSPNQLEYVRVENEVGVLVMTFPRKGVQFSQFAVGDIMEVWRNKNNITALQNEISYFLQNWKFYTESDGREMIELTAQDANWLLGSAVVSDYSGSPYASMTKKGDDMMKAIVRRQLSSGYQWSADQNKMTVQLDLGQCSEAITKEFAWRNVLEVLKDIAEQVRQNDVSDYLCFDVVRTGNASFEFRTFLGQRGINHGLGSPDVRLVGVQYGNFANASFSIEHADVRNYIYVAGQGQNDAREIVKVSDATSMTASKWNRRELLVDARDLETIPALTADGNAALTKNRTKRILEGTLIDTPGMTYGIHYGFGDIVSAEAFGFQVNCHISSVHVTYDQDKGEQFDVRLRGEL